MFNSPYKSFHIGRLAIHLWKQPRFDYGIANGDYWGHTQIYYLQIGYVEIAWLFIVKK